MTQWIHLVYNDIKDKKLTQDLVLYMYKSYCILKLSCIQLQITQQFATHDSLQMISTEIAIKW